MKPATPPATSPADTKPPPHAWADEAALLSVAVIWASTFLVGSILVRQVSPAQVLVTRFAVAAAVLLALCRRPWRAGPGLCRGGIVLGLWLAAAFALQMLGLVYTTPARCAFITGFCVVLPPLVGAVLERRRPAARALLAAMLAGAGVGLIGWPGAGEAVNLGDVLSALCALAYGVHIYLAGYHAARAEADHLAALQIAVAWAVFLAGTLAALLALHLAGAGKAPAWAAAVAGRPWVWSPAIVGSILYLALFATVVAYFLQMRSQRRVPPARVGILFAAEPVVAGILSVALGHDPLSLRLILGGALVVAGIVASTEGPPGGVTSGQ